MSVIDYTVTQALKETGSADEAVDHTEGPVVTSVKACQVQRP